MCLTEQLENLALAAQKAPPKSLERQKFLGEMFKLIEENNLLFKPPKNNLSSQQYQLLYEEAKAKTFLATCRNIDRFDRSKGQIMTWINAYIRGNFQTLFKQFIQPLTPGQVKNNRRPRIINFSDLAGGNNSPENLLHDDQSTLNQREEMVRNFLQEDPEGLLSNAHIRGFPEITLQKLLLMKYVEDVTLEIMSQRLKLSISTIDSFMKRHLRSQGIRDYFDKYLGDN